MDRKCFSFRNRKNCRRYNFQYNLVWRQLNLQCEAEMLFGGLNTERCFRRYLISINYFRLFRLDGYQ